MKSLQAILEECRYEFGDDEITDINQHSPSGDTPLHVMCMAGDIEAVETLVAAGADINAMGDLGRTPLFVAIMIGNLELIRYLLSQGCVLTHRDDFEKTPLEYARLIYLDNTKSGHEIIALLEAQ